MALSQELVEKSVQVEEKLLGLYLEYQDNKILAQGLRGWRDLLTRRRIYNGDGVIVRGWNDDGTPREKEEFTDDDLRQILGHVEAYLSPQK